MKLAFLQNGVLESEATWSGIPLNILRTLRSLGHDVVVIDRLQPHAPMWARIKTWFHRYARKRLYLVNRDPRVIRAQAADGNRRLAALGRVDAVLVAYPPNAAFVRSSSPVILIHDATWPLLLDYYPGHERASLAEETIRGGMELERMGLARCAHLIYSSHWAAGSAMKDFGVQPERISIAPLGASIANAPAREEVAGYLRRRGQGPMKLLFVGVQWLRKGGEVAVGVAAEIERRGIAVELHVAGCDPEGNVPLFVRRHGMLRKDVDREAQELRGLQESCDFLLVPTRAEAFGIVFAEAAAFGLPVMAADTGGTRDAIKGGWGIAPPLDAPANVYADWAIELFRDRARYEELAWMAREAYEKDLNWISFCRHIEQTVKRLKQASAAAG